MPLNVTFRAGTLAQYNALQTKDEGTLYFITDKNLIYRGETLVTSRYLISSVPNMNIDGVNGFRLTDQVTGNTYDIPFLNSVNGMLDSNLVLRFKDGFISSDREFLLAISAETGNPGTGEFQEGTVFRMADQLLIGEDRVNEINLNPGQFAHPDNLVVKAHDLVVAIRSHKIDDRPFETNHSCFAVIPVDLVNLVTADGTLNAGALVLGGGGKTVRTMAFSGANKILRINSSNNGVEWVTPETVQNVMTWEDIVVE